jgi:peptidoglycan/xylan/chitin deacetylase (PgdA/CDA1 family)
VPSPLRPLALAYHGAADVALRDDPNGLFVGPRSIERHIGRLRDWGYRLVSFGELARLASNEAAEGHAALTFDDGLADNLEQLAPLLAREEVPATVFVVSGWLGGPHPEEPRGRIMNAEELRALAAAGIEVGGHTETHPDLTRLSYEQARAELEGCKRALEAILDAPVEVAAYPYGEANEVTFAACKDAGFRAACLNRGRGSWTNPHALPRDDMNNGVTMIGLRLRRHGHYQPLMRLAAGRAIRSVARRIRTRLDV